MTGSIQTGVRDRWLLLVLLIIVMIMSFFDRGNLAVAAPRLGPELHLSPWSLGILLSAFFWTYSVGQIGSGWLVDRVEVRWVYAGGFLLWSIATLATGLVSTFSSLLVMRLLLGIGESVAYPATSHVLAATFPERRRGLANSLIDLGARLGPALGTACGALLVKHTGWRGLFLVTGAVGLVWLIPWMLVAPRQLVTETAHAAAGRLGWPQLLSRRDVWGTVGGLCGANYAWYFLLSWLPSYLVNERRFSFDSLAFWGSLPYIVMAVASVSCGALADRRIARGGSAVRVRQRFLVTGLLLTALFFPVTLVPDIRYALAGLLAACFAFGIYASNLFSLTQTLAGPEASGRWTGLQNAFGNVAGIVSAIVTGWLVRETGTYVVAFFAAGVSCVLGAASFGLLVREPAAALSSAQSVRAARARTP